MLASPTGPIAYQGAPGAYSEAALRRCFGDNAAALPCSSFAAVFEAVAGGQAAAGVIPIENSLAGSIMENHDLLLSHELLIIGELTLPVRHCLLGLPGSRLADIHRAYSHPQALQQSMPFLEANGIEPIVASDTAGAARELAARQDPHAAAVASQLAGTLYGLEVLAEGIQSRPDNTTRFFVIALHPPAGLAAEKASLVFVAPNRPGSLHACLGHFAAAGLDLTKIESRPTRDTPWEYRFYVDFVGELGGGAIARLVAALHQEGAEARLLGVYPREAGLAKQAVS